MIKVSIIVPVYNVEKYLDQCLNSLVNQTLKDIEIIVVNDGTKDNSQMIIDDYQNRYPNLIRSYIKKNGGNASARNYGIKKAKGEFLGFVDSDDYVEKDMFEFLYNQIINNNADISICGHTTFNENGIENVIRNDGNVSIYNNIEATELIIKDKDINSFLWDKLFKKNLFDGEAIPSFTYHEDFGFLFKILYKSRKVVVANESKYFYRRNYNSISFNLSSTRIYDGFLAHVERQNFAKKNLKSCISTTTIGLAQRAIVSMNTFIRNNEYDINKNKIDLIRKVIKDNIWLILKNKNIPITDKLYSIMSLISMRMYMNVAKLNLRK